MVNSPYISQKLQDKQAALEAKEMKLREAEEAWTMSQQEMARIRGIVTRITHEIRHFEGLQNAINECKTHQREKSGELPTRPLHAITDHTRRRELFRALPTSLSKNIQLWLCDSEDYIIPEDFQSTLDDRNAIAHITINPERIRDDLYEKFTGESLEGKTPEEILSKKIRITPILREYLSYAQVDQKIENTGSLDEIRSHGYRIISIPTLQNHHHPHHARRIYIMFCERQYRNDPPKTVVTVFDSIYPLYRRLQYEERRIKSTKIKTEKRKSGIHTIHGKFSQAPNSTVREIADEFAAEVLDIADWCATLTNPQGSRVHELLTSAATMQDRTGRYHPTGTERKLYWAERIEEKEVKRYFNQLPHIRENSRHIWPLINEWLSYADSISAELQNSHYSLEKKFKDLQKKLAQYENIYHHIPEPIATYHEVIHSIMHHKDYRDAHKLAKIYWTLQVAILEHILHQIILAIRLWIINGNPGEFFSKRSRLKYFHENCLPINRNHPEQSMFDENRMRDGVVQAKIDQLKHLSETWLHALYACEKDKKHDLDRLKDFADTVRKFRFHTLI